MNHLIFRFGASVFALVGVLSLGSVSRREWPLVREPGNHVSNQSSQNDSLLKELVALEKQSWEAWKQRDGKFFQDFLSDDHVDLGARGVVRKAAVVAGVSSPICVVSGYVVDNFELTILDPRTALLTYHAEQSTTCGGNPVPSPVWVSGLFVRRGDRWLNALHQQTPAARN